MSIFDFIFKSKKWSSTTDDVVKFKKKYSAPGRMGGTCTYEVWRAPSAQAAKEYLNTRVITQRLYYLVVETPEGNWGKDVDGVYKE
jgi:hypothetical protein